MPILAANSRTLEQRAEAIEEQFPSPTVEVTFDVVRRVLILLRNNPLLTDDQVLVVIRRKVNPIADYWSMENL